MPIPTADWSNTSDPEILRFMNGHRRPFATTPAVVAANAPLSRSHAQRRMLKLKEVGMVKKAPDIEEQGYYMITEFGKKWIQGELTEDDLVRPDEGRDEDD